MMRCWQKGELFQYKECAGVSSVTKESGHNISDMIQHTKICWSRAEQRRTFDKIGRFYGDRLASKSSFLFLHPFCPLFPLILGQHSQSVRFITPRYLLYCGLGMSLLIWHKRTTLWQGRGQRRVNGRPSSCAWINPKVPQLLSSSFLFHSILLIRNANHSNSVVERTPNDWTNFRSHHHP